VTQDPPDQPDDATSTPDPEPGTPEQEIAPGASAADELPEPPPQVELISDADLKWLDEPQLSDEERERRHERKERHKAKVRAQRRHRKWLKIAGVAFATFLVLFAFWFQWTLGGLNRMPATAGQAGLNTPGTTMLLVGSNPSEPDATVAGRSWQAALHRSDLVMLLHLTRNNRAMFVISIPGRSVLPIPGHGEGRLGQAYDTGGEKLYVRTIESYTGVRLDHIAVMDLNGLREITDEVGGIVVDVPSEACGIPPGLRRLDGQQALDYMALQPCLPRKDVDRVEREQGVMRALMRGAVDGGKLTNPFRLNKILRSTAGHLTLEKGFSYPGMLGQVWSMRKLRTTNTTFLTVPVAAKPNGRVGKDDVVLLDPAKDQALWDALRKDRIADYLALNADADVLE
jgi:LCP family protein required for cell wall assembly